MINNLPNFINNKETFKVKEVPGILTVVNFEQINDDIENNNYINCIPTSFISPKLNNIGFNIVVDNNFDLDPLIDKNVIFIDHHLSEVVHNKKFSSNSLLIYNNYDKIKSFFKNIILNNCVTIYYHSDVDGIMSCFLIKAMIYEIKNKKNIDKDILIMMMVLGENGDISPNMEDSVMEWNTSIIPDGLNIENFIKKIHNHITGLSRFIKIIRPYMNNLILDENLPIVKKIEETSSNRIGNGILKKITYKFMNSINNMNQYTIIGLLNFCNIIASDFDYTSLKNVFEEEKTNLASLLVYPTSSNNNFRIYGTFGNNNEIYDILLISSWIDIGRTLCWSYLGKLKYYKQDQYENDGTFYNHRYIGGISKIIERSTNIACYNNFLEKLVLNSNNESAFLIGQELGGGGHNNISTSIGSVIISLDDLMSNIKIISIE
jgi:hypothetical protein